MLKLRSGREPAPGGVSVYLPVNAYGQPIGFLVDTGASATVLNSGVYQKMNQRTRPELQKTPVPMEMEAADGKVFPIEGYVELEFQAGGETFMWKMFVAPIADEGLLGLDFLEGHDFVMSSQSGLKLGGRSVPLEWTGRGQPIIPVSLKRAAMIPAWSEQVVWCPVPKEVGKGPVLVEGLSDPAPEEVLVSRVVATPCRGHVPVRVMNPGQGEVRLGRGTRLARVQSLRSQDILEPSTSAEQPLHIYLV